MFLVKPCPSCKVKLRFPIDRGIIKVKCRCGYSFTADPDDPALYRDGKIDPVSGPPQGFFDPIKSFISGINSAELKLKLINSFLNFKYNLQNFSLMPTREKAIFLARAGAVILLVAIVFFLIMKLSCGSPSPDELVT